jgi:hypothetical protein
MYSGMLHFLACEQTVSDISKDCSAFISCSSNLLRVTDMATRSRRLESPVLFSTLLLSQIISRSTPFKTTEGHKSTPPSPGHPVAMFSNTRINILLYCTITIISSLKDCFATERDVTLEVLRIICKSSKTSKCKMKGTPAVSHNSF